MDNGVLIVFEVQSRKDDMLYDLLSNPRQNNQSY